MFLRIVHALAIAGIVGSAIYAYTIKYETIWHGEQVAKLRHSIEREKDGIAVLRAEWAHLSRPARIQALADKHLPELQPMALTQIARFADLPERAPKVDAIGRKLELLGLAEPTNTPGQAGAAPAPPSPTKP
ncbi:MAG: hypothetical protein JNK46_03030 [Methylobacteriaceae bacterium]|nr:hypothetical protein [Methylobacteriaceae bacterium]